MAKNVDDFFLELGNRIIAHQLGFVTVLEDDIACLEICKDNTLNKIEHIQANLHLGSSILDFNFQDMTFIARPRPSIDDDLIVRSKLIDRLVYVEIQILILEHLNEVTDVSITGYNLCAVVMAIIEQPQSGLIVPFGVNDLVNALR